jgi:uncharacterized membrane-anchored protein YitT (DUF2179 family)
MNLLSENLMKSKTYLIIKKYLIILIFSFVYAMGISLFLSPNNLAPGGVSGLSIIIHHYTGISTGILYFSINIPIISVGIYKLGIKFISSTIVTIGLTSIFMDVLGNAHVITDNKILAALTGGVLVAVGLGMIFRAGSTSGGTDIIVKLLKMKYPHIETGRLFLFLDAAIIAISAVAFKDIEAALFAGISAVVASVTLDKVLYGTDGAKLVFIISNDEEAIARRLLTDIETGVTYLNGTGAYTDVNKQVILCAVKKQNLPKLQAIVRDVDPAAFMIVSSASEVVGEGYKSHFQEKI